MSCRTQAAIGSASMMPSTAAFWLFLYARLKVPAGQSPLSQAEAQSAKSAMRGS
jgi:hypothetical protein